MNDKRQHAWWLHHDKRIIEALINENVAHDQILLQSMLDETNERIKKFHEINDANQDH